MQSRFVTSVFVIIWSTICLTAPCQAQQARQSASPPGVRVERDIRYVLDGDPAQSLGLYLPEKPGDKHLKGMDVKIEALPDADITVIPPAAKPG